MHVLTLIGCVLFSDVGLRDRGRRRGKDGEGRGQMLRDKLCVCVCVCACVCACMAQMNLLNSVCSFAPPWERRGKMKGGSDREEIKDLKAIDFLFSYCMCLFWRLLCFNIVYQKDCSGFSGEGKQEYAPQQNYTQRKLIGYRTGITMETLVLSDVREIHLLQAYFLCLMFYICFPFIRRA